MKFLITILLLICPTLVFAQNCNNVKVVTGFGYITDSNGHIILQPQYNPGSTVCIPAGETYTEVANFAALSAYPLWVDPNVIAQQQQETLIQQDIRALAIADLQQQGILNNEEVTSENSNLTTLNTAKSSIKNQTVNATLP
jgi:hypothetical protein